MTWYCSMRMGDLQWGDNGVAMTYSRLHMALAHVYTLHMLAHLHIYLWCEQPHQAGDSGA